MKFLTSLTLVLIFALSTFNSANATIISINDTNLGALNLNESFIDFYSYGNSIGASSNTGYEKNNAMVMFFAEYNGDLALYVIADSASSTGDGTANFTMANFNTFGSIIFKDDPTEVSTTGAVNWKWLSGRNDGLIYQINDTENFNIDFAISNISGLGNGYQLLSFDENNDVTQYNNTFSNGTNNFNMGGVSSIPEPTSIAMLGLALFGLAAARPKA